MKNKFLLLFTFIVLVLQSCIPDKEDPIAVAPFEGDLINANVGGAAQPNQVWVDLSTGTQTSTNRTKWDLGFYSGAEFKVILNSSIMMAAGKIEGKMDINSVNSSNIAQLMELVQVANFNPLNEQYIDDVKGNYITGYTAISEINTASNSPIYLVNMGKKIFTGSISTGSAITGGEFRGWMKIQITRSGNDYKIKYAKLDDTSFKEKTITKNPDYNFTFYSLENNTEVLIQPEKKKWDLGFTVFTNTITGAGSYIFADFVVHNTLGNTGAYMVTVPAGSNATEIFNNFSKEKVDASKLIYNDHRTIGASWRNPIGANGLEVYGDRFYIIKDAEGLYYKLKFTRMTSESGERGFPQFEYKPL